VDFLKKAGQHYWQILPLNYTTSQTSFSPYNCFSAFAGNSLLISPELLYRDGFLKKKELKDVPAFDPSRIDYKKVSLYKLKLLDKAVRRFLENPQINLGAKYFDNFVRENEFWLEDFATFVALKHKFGQRFWCDWPSELRDRKRQYYIQYIFYKQYRQLKDYCLKSGIKIIGDIPIYVAFDSADVWAYPEYFKLTKMKKPKFIAGVPPDYFSRTGQLWGNPVYNWPKLQDDNFTWWMKRIKHNLRLYDLVRIDHFRGLIAYWQIPAGHKVATHGRWVKAPKDEFFAALFKQFPEAPIFAEDLGYITADVREVIKRFSFPCMRVLQFGFAGDPTNNPHYPHNHIENCIVYTGTHDNNTTKGWFENEATAEQKRQLFDYLAYKVSAEWAWPSLTGDVHWGMIRLALGSVAKVAIIPMQDILGLGSESRMNHPARKTGNWLWQMRQNQISLPLADKLRKMTEIYSRV
jgi:4-alpha-glucanotransferase